MAKKFNLLEIIVNSELILTPSLTSKGTPKTLFIGELKKCDRKYKGDPIGGEYVIGPGDDQELSYTFLRGYANAKYLVTLLRPSINKPVKQGVIELSLSNHMKIQIHRTKATLPQNIAYKSILFSDYQKLIPGEVL